MFVLQIYPKYPTTKEVNHIFRTDIQIVTLATNNCMSHDQYPMHILLWMYLLNLIDSSIETLMKLSWKQISHVTFIQPISTILFCIML